jgi:Ca2+-binding RTX toxin-like protein
MLLLTYFGNSTDFFDEAFASSGGFDPDIVSTSSTEIVLRNPDTGFLVTFRGTGLPLNPSTTLTGTVTQLIIDDDSGNPVATFTGISWTLAAIAAALDASVENGDDAPLNALLSLQEVRVEGFPANAPISAQFDGITSRATIYGTPFQDTLGGGTNNDYINPGPSTEGENIFGSGGSDLIDFTDHSPFAWAWLSYEELAGPVNVLLNGQTDTGRVEKPGFVTDTIIAVNNVLRADGLTIVGTGAGDTFTVDSGPGGWSSYNGRGGNDTFNVTLSQGSTVRLDYRDGNAAGINVNLATGTASDGLGGTDTLNITHQGGQLEVRGTDQSDIFTGTDARERFIPRGGNDVINAGGGFDVVRYDQDMPFFDGLFVSIVGGTITGSMTGNGPLGPFIQDFTHQISGVEGVRGTSLNDTMQGSAADEYFQGNDGNDLLEGGGGNDTLEGNEGSDSLVGGDGNDRLEGGEGNDTLRGGAGNDSLYGREGDDLIDPGDNTGSDWVRPGEGNDTVLAGGVQTGYLALNHSSIADQTGFAVTVDMNDAQGRGFVDKGTFGTTIIEAVNTPLLADGMEIWGSELDDTFAITLNPNAFLGLFGGRGNDSYTIAGAGGRSIVRLNFQESNSFEPAEQGLVANLGTGVIANDGFGGQDTLVRTGDIRIELRGTHLADSMTGSAGNDRFIGGGGNDSIDGQEGFDLIRFDRNELNAGVQVNLGTGRATGVWDGADFTQTLSNIEGVRGTRNFDDRIFGALQAEFLDGQGGTDEYLEGLGGNDRIFGDGPLAWYYDAAVANQVYRLYQATLDRAPDVAGHADWAGRIGTGDTPLSGAAAGFVGSREFQNVYGALDNAAFVELLYQNVLGRPSDPGGRQTWLDALAGGASRADVVLGFSESREFVNATTQAANAYAFNSDPANWTDEVFRMYQATLGRDPDAPGLLDWAENLGSGRFTLTDVAGGFVGSREFQNVYGALDNQQFVELLYQNVLGRASTPQERQGWLDALAGGASRADIVVGFSESREFTLATTGALKDWVRALGTHDSLLGGAGDNTLAGGMFADVFVFNPVDGGNSTVLDLEAWDLIDVAGFGYADGAEVRSHLSQQGAHVILADQGTTVTFQNTALAEITDDMFIGLTGGGGEGSGGSLGL